MDAGLILELLDKVPESVQSCDLGVWLKSDIIPLLLDTTSSDDAIVRRHVPCSSLVCSSLSPHRLVLLIGSIVMCAEWSSQRRWLLHYCLAALHVLTTAMLAG